MFISTLDLFKIGVGPSSSHTMGPMIAAHLFLEQLNQYKYKKNSEYQLHCILKGSLAFTGKGHSTDKAVLLGLLGYLPDQLVNEDIEQLINTNKLIEYLEVNQLKITFNFKNNLVFDYKASELEHPNSLQFILSSNVNDCEMQQTYCSVGGGFVLTQEELKTSLNKETTNSNSHYVYGFKSADEMLTMAEQNNLTIADMKLANECCLVKVNRINEGLDAIWHSMKRCVENGLNASGILPGGLMVERRAQSIHQALLSHPDDATVNDWLCAYAMAVNEENAAGHMVVTAPTNGAAGVIPAVLYYAVNHQKTTQQQIREFLLTAGAMGGLIKYNSSISGAEVGCQGEVGSASAMAAAGLCAFKGGSPTQVENAAEIALEHHLGMTCDPVKGLVQIPCIERNGFGAIKAFTASSLALYGTGQHKMSLDRCIAAMKRTGEEMSYKYKETSLGGLAVSNTEC